MSPLSQWLAWADAYTPYAVAVAGFVGAVWHMIPQEMRDAFERRFPRIVGGIRMLYMVGPDLHGAYLTLRQQLIAGQPKRGFARTWALYAVCLVCFVLAALLSACPVWERPACGSPRSYQCVNNQPHVCSPSGRLTPIGDEPCPAGSTCALGDAGVAHCMAGGAP